MQDKTVLITGTASGMGRIAAKALADKGARLILVDFDTDEGINSKDEICLLYTSPSPRDS